MKNFGSWKRLPPGVKMSYTTISMIFIGISRIFSPIQIMRLEQRALSCTEPVSFSSILMNIWGDGKPFERVGTIQEIMQAQ